MNADIGKSVGQVDAYCIHVVCVHNSIDIWGPERRERGRGRERQEFPESKRLEIDSVPRLVAFAHLVGEGGEVVG